MPLSPSQLGCKSTSQIVPDHAAYNRQTKRYSARSHAFSKPQRSVLALTPVCL